MMPTMDAVRARVDVTDSGCWMWQQSVNNRGYAISRVSLGGSAMKTRTVHRLVVELTRGQIADGMQVDHLCVVRRCVNPDHLEVVTPQVNALRALARIESTGRVS